MKVLVIALTLVLSSFAHADSNTQSAAKLISVLSRALPAASEHPNYWGNFSKGKTRDGQECGVQYRSNQNSLYVRMGYHPDMSTADQNDSKYEFVFDETDTTDMFGKIPQIELKESRGSMEATLVRPSGYGVLKSGLILAQQGRQLSVSVRSKTGIFSKYVECLF